MTLKQISFPINKTHTQVGEVRLADPGNFIVAGIEMSGFFGEGRNTVQLQVITVHRSDQTGAQHTGGHTLPPNQQVVFRRQTQKHIKTQKLYWCISSSSLIGYTSTQFCLSHKETAKPQCLTKSHEHVLHTVQYVGILLLKGHLSAGY